MRGRSTTTGYAIGFVACAALTVGPFAAVAAGWGPRPWLVLLVAGCAAVQILVQLRWFLHVDPRRSRPETLLAAGFAMVVVGIMTGGTFWIMASLARRMGEAGMGGM